MLFCTAKMNMRLLHEGEPTRLNEGTFRSVKCNICWSTAAKSREACDVHAFVLAHMCATNGTRRHEHIHACARKVRRVKRNRSVLWFHLLL